MKEIIEELLNTIKKLNSKVRELQLEKEDSPEVTDSYYEKYKLSNAENLSLKEKIADLEIKISSLNFELEQRNNRIVNLKEQLHF